MSVEFRPFESEQIARATLHNELRNALAAGPDYGATIGDGTVADRTATAPYVIMLPGGSTPMRVYDQIAGEPPPIVHPAVHLLVSDDRYVPADDERSNFGRIARMVQTLGLPPERFIHIDPARSIEAAAAALGTRIGELMERDALFGLGVLGIGSDGHTASIFSASDVPGTVGPPPPRAQEPAEPLPSGTVVADPDPSAYAVPTVAVAGVRRITLTARVLLAFRRLVFFATGGDKFDILYELSRRPEEYAAGRILLQHQRAEIWTDQAPAVR